MPVRAVGRMWAILEQNPTIEVHEPLKLTSWESSRSVIIGLLWVGPCTANRPQ